MREIPLTQGYVALVDDADYERVAAFKWHACVNRRTVYAVRAEWIPGHPKKIIQMHRFILGIRGVDHIDGNGLNNQQDNLRSATIAQNAANQRKAAGKSSRFKGVYWYKAGQAWCAQIRVNRKSRYLGVFREECDAAQAYNFAAAEAFGEFALFNTPETGRAAIQRLTEGQ